MDATQDHTEYLDIDGLKYNAVDAKPIDFTFESSNNETHQDEYGAGTWRIADKIQAESGECDCGACDGEGEDSDVCEKCGGIGHVGENEDIVCEDCDCGYVSETCPVCDGNGTEDLDDGDPEAWWPKINAAYAIPDLDLPDNWRDCLHNMTVVQIEDKTYLAQTGGGMDLSWAIAETYIRLGYYPPSALRLPHSCRGLSRRDRSIIAACKISAQTQIGWMESRLENLNDIVPREERRLERNTRAQESAGV